MVVGLTIICVQDGRLSQDGFFRLCYDMGYYIRDVEVFTDVVGMMRCCLVGGLFS